MNSIRHALSLSKRGTRDNRYREDDGDSQSQSIPTQTTSAIGIDSERDRQ